MNTRSMWVVGLAVVLAVVFSGGLFAAGALDAIKVKSGEVGGLVSDSSGKLLADIAVRLTKDGKEACSVKSDKAGVYSLGELAEGRYELFVGAEKPLTLVASADAKTATLRIILPQTSGHGESEILGMPTWAVVGGGIIVTAAVVTPVVMNSSGGGDGVSGRVR